MSSFALVLLLAAAATAASVPGPAPGAEPAGPGHIRSFALFGHPAAAAGAVGIRGVDVEDIPINELGGWRSVYEKPIVVAVKKADKPEIAAFLAKDGLAGLAKSPETRPLHELLKTGEEKVGIMLSAAKFLSAPEFDLPIPKVVYPKGVTLATAARAQAENNGYPWVLVAPQSELKTTELAKLALVGDFTVTENAVKVASDIPSAADASPVARFAGIDASPMHMHYGLEPESASGETTITIRTNTPVSHSAGAPFPAMIRAFPTLSKFAPASDFASTKFAASSPKYVLVPEFAPAAAKFAPSTKYVLIPEYASEYAPNAQFAPSTKQYALAPEFAPAPYAIAARHPALAGAALESDAPAVAYLTMRSGHSKRFTADPADPIAAEPATAGSAPSRSAHPEHSPAKAAHAENAPARAAAAAAAPTAGAPMPGSAASHA